MKVMDKYHIKKENKIEHVLLEKKILTELSSPYVIKLILSFHDFENLYICMEYAAGGNLMEYIDKITEIKEKEGVLNTSFSSGMAQFYAAEIVEALEYIHMYGVIHRDLKPENILVTLEGHIKLGDFGSALLVSNEELHTSSSIPKDPPYPESRSRKDSQTKHSFCGTSEYVSPEVLRDIQATKSSDIWALGCITFKMLTGRSPFMAGSEYLIFKKILAHADNPDSSVSDIEYPDFIKECEKDFIEALLKGNPELRLGVGASRYLSDDIHRGRGEEECYNNSNIDDYDGDHDNNDSNNDNDKNNEDNNNDDSNLKGTNYTDTNKICLNYEKISTITEKNDLKSHTFFENIKWDFLIQNPVPPFWAQTGPAFYPDPLEDINAEFKNLYSEFACTISDENDKNETVINSAHMDDNENEILDNNDNEIINNQEVLSNNIYNNSDNSDTTNDDLCPEKCSVESCSTTSTMESSFDTYITV
eukprot:CAMPEP_0119051414 /NCGR_PEP_ID=MMETSP1177-20130426/73036_1 /TAXON_ID=2985 /ORGANISM="Ochromonas sp, Strain CCMP1899" /LENGTH=475 /DNA_ID=CAMNT_0007030605 /DNA_START=224 /DNA_END=1651 /DNA_ORIENTATION=+